MKVANKVVVSMVMMVASKIVVKRAVSLVVVVVWDWHSARKECESTLNAYPCICEHVTLLTGIDRTP